MAYFPMFIDLAEVPCLVIGGGTIAERKVRVLQDFGAEVYVAAEAYAAPSDNVHFLQRCLTPEGIPALLEAVEPALVVAATDDHELNHAISLCCKERKISVNAVDQKEDCTFIFPSYAKEQDVVAAFSSGGSSPLIAQYLKAQIEEVMTPFVGELAAWLGSVRDEVKERVAAQRDRKQVFQALMDLALREQRLPTDTEKEDLIRRGNEHAL